jgi:hypothetical protein
VPLGEGKMLTTACGGLRSEAGFLVPSGPTLAPSSACPCLRLLGNDRQRTETTRDWDLLSPEAPVMVSV